MKHIKIIYDTTGSLLSLIKNYLHQEVSAVYQAFANTLYSVHHLCDLRMDTKKCVYHQRNLVFNSLVMTLPSQVCETLATEGFPNTVNQI